MTKVHILALDGTSVDQTDRFKTLVQAERYFRSKWQWCDGLEVRQYG